MICRVSQIDEDMIFCTKGAHAWIDPEDRNRCCNGYIRVQGTSRKELEQAGAEHIVKRQMWRGWLRSPEHKEVYP